MPGATFALRVPDATGIGGEGRRQFRVNAPSVDGRASEAERQLRAQALRVARSRLTPIRGETARDTAFRPA